MTAPDVDRSPVAAISAAIDEGKRLAGQVSPQYAALLRAAELLELAARTDDPAHAHRLESIARAWLTLVQALG